MKNIFKRLIAANVCAVMAMAVGTACSPQVKVEDDSRPAIRVSVFNGGYGRAWLDTIVEDFNAEHPDYAYKISVNANKDEFNSILSSVQSGNYDSDMFFSNAYIYKFVAGKYLEDLSSVWTSAAESGEKTIEERMFYSDEYKKAYGDGKGGIYGIPLQETVRSFIYDHDLFLKYRLLYMNFIVKINQKPKTKI